MGIKKSDVLKLCLLIGLIFQTSFVKGSLKETAPVLRYSVSMSDAANHLVHITLFCNGLKSDTIDFKMPKWMPGYYQIMNYSDDVRNFIATNRKGMRLTSIKANQNTWKVIPGNNSSFSVSYDVFANKNFVASNFLDTTHAYIVPAATFLYIDGFLNTPVNVIITTYTGWKDIATGLNPVNSITNEFAAPDFDILYDCPILAGNLNELPSFEIDGIVHRFIAYNPGSFNRELFISSLEKVVRAGIDIFDDIPYDEYTFIGIGHGYGGIEHLNNTTVSFSGNGLDKPGDMTRTLNFLAHEYFHHYNVKRIRPFELGPFDYDRVNRTNLLWVSEGLTVYYEYLTVKRAGLMSDDEYLSNIAGNINAFENDEGRHYQSLSEASYETWDEGPFGDRSAGPDMSISYYDKGPLAGMILDLSIRNATSNRKSLDDVMRYLYWQYYKKLNRGFTDAEFQQACQDIAGVSMSSEFEYVNTTKEIDYSKYLSYAGLKLTEEKDMKTGKRKFTLSRQENLSSAQESIFRSWSGN